MTSKNNRAPLLYFIKLCTSFQTHWWIQTGVTVQKCLIWVKIGNILSCDRPCVLEIWWMTLKNNREPLLCHFKLYKSFQSHRWIQTGVTARKRSIRLKISHICPLWPWDLMDDLEKTIRHLFFATPRFEHHFIAICWFKLKSQFGSKSINF